MKNDRHDSLICIRNSCCSVLFASQLNKINDNCFFGFFFFFHSNYLMRCVCVFILNLNSVETKKEYLASAQGDFLLNIQLRRHGYIWTWALNTLFIHQCAHVYRSNAFNSITYAVGLISNSWCIARVLVTFNKKKKKTISITFEPSLGHVYNLL